jgi:hypothetical protein
MRRIDSVVGEQWTIVDERGRVVFVGTKQGCEDWLDYQDNAQRRPSAVTTWIRWLFAAWLTPPVRVSRNCFFPRLAWPRLTCRSRDAIARNRDGFCTVGNKTL